MYPAALFKHYATATYCTKMTSFFVSCPQNAMNCWQANRKIKGSASLNNSFGFCLVGAEQKPEAAIHGLRLCVLRCGHILDLVDLELYW